MAQRSSRMKISVQLRLLNQRASRYQKHRGPKGSSNVTRSRRVNLGLVSEEILVLCRWCVELNEYMVLSMIR